MLLSFNDCSISALTAPVYQSVEETLLSSRKLDFFISIPFSIAVCVTDHLSVCMYKIPRDCQWWLQSMALLIFYSIAKVKPTIKLKT